MNGLPWANRERRQGLSRALAVPLCLVNWRQRTNAAVPAGSPGRRRWAFCPVGLQAAATEPAAWSWQQAQAWPLWLLGLLLALWLLWPRPLPESWPPRQRVLVRRRPAARFAAAFALLLLAVAAQGPVGRPQPVLEPGPRELLCLLDVSRSMTARDSHPSRLERAQEELCQLSRAAPGDRLGLLLCAGQARLAVPLTRDLEALQVAIKSAGPSSLTEGGSDLVAGLAAARALLENALSPQGGRPTSAGQASPQSASGSSTANPSARSASRALVLCTDGEAEPALELSALLADWPRNVPIFVLGLGSARGARLPVPQAQGGESYLLDAAGRPVESRAEHDPWRALAEATGGAFLDERAPPGSLAASVLSQVPVTSVPVPERTQPAPIWRLFLGAALGCAWLAALFWSLGR